MSDSYLNFTQDKNYTTENEFYLEDLFGDISVTTAESVDATLGENYATESEFNLEDIFGHLSSTTEESIKLTNGLDDRSWLAMRQYYSKVLMGLAKNSNTAAGLMGLNATGFDDFLSPHNSALANLSIHLTSLVKRRRDPGRTVIIILVYSILIAVSLFGNLLVCHVVLRTRRLHTLTNTFLANLAVSDLLMTALNIPFNVARVLLDDWPFGGFMCSIVPFVQVTSVYVSAFTMVAIALDRYQVIVHPLKPRLGAFHGAIIITVVWFLAGFVSLPYAIYSEVVEVFTYRKLIRCQAHYPSPALQFRKWLTLGTFLTQYVIPLSITAVAYVGVTRRVWWRAVVGTATQEQLSLQLRAKKKTVKMLLVVVVLFAFCWLPLNTYHLVVDFGTAVGPSRHSSTIFFMCHWFAMSNVCYNPFIYCWLNDHFRAGAKSWLRCVARKICRIPLPDDIEEHPGTRISRPRDSITLSSSALFGGSSVRRKMEKGSVRSNQPSDFHVTLDELLVNPTRSRGKPHRLGQSSEQEKLGQSSSKYSSTKSRQSYHNDSLTLSLQSKDDKVVCIGDICTMQNIPNTYTNLSEISKIDANPPFHTDFQTKETQCHHSDAIDMHDQFQTSKKDQELDTYQKSTTSRKKDSTTKVEQILDLKTKQKLGRIEIDPPDIEPVMQNTNLQPIKDEFPKMLAPKKVQFPRKEKTRNNNNSQITESVSELVVTEDTLPVEKKSQVRTKINSEKNSLSKNYNNPEVKCIPKDSIRRIHGSIASYNVDSQKNPDIAFSHSFYCLDDQVLLCPLAHRPVTGNQNTSERNISRLMSYNGINREMSVDTGFTNDQDPSSIANGFNSTHQIRLKPESNNRKGRQRELNRVQDTTLILSPLIYDVICTTKRPYYSDICLATENNSISRSLPNEKIENHPKINKNRLLNFSERHNICKNSRSNVAHDILPVFHPVYKIKSHSHSLPNLSVLSTQKINVFRSKSKDPQQPIHTCKFKTL